MRLSVGVKLLIKNNKGLYVLIQRSEPLSDGTGIRWDIPGGRIEPSERLKEALAREVREEIGIELNTPLSLVMAQDIIVPNISLHVVRLTYLAQLDAHIELGEEHQSFEWVSRDDALKFNIDPYLREALEAL